MPANSPLNNVHEVRLGAAAETASPSMKSPIDQSQINKELVLGKRQGRQHRAATR